MLVSLKKIDKMLKDRDRLEKMARMEYEEARQLYSMGSLDFAVELQLANQHLGASREITKTLKRLGYDESKRLSERDRELIIAGIKQKLCGVGVIGFGTMFISSGVPALFIILSLIGSGLCVTKENVLSLYKYNKQ